MIAADNEEITALKGGSHWHRFWIGAKHVSVGAVVGVVVGIAVDRTVIK